MKTIIEYLDDLKEKTGSDNKAAAALNISRISVNQIRKRGSMADETAIKMADLLGIDRDELLIAAAIARSEGTTKEAWINHAKRFGIAASIIISVFSPLLANGYLYQTPNMYIMLKSIQIWLTLFISGKCQLFARLRWLYAQHENPQLRSSGHWIDIRNRLSLYASIWNRSESIARFSGNSARIRNTPWKQVWETEARKTYRAYLEPRTPSKFTDSEISFGKFAA